MNCPHCSKEIEGQDNWFLPNLIVPTFIVGLIIIHMLPWDIEHGYSLNFDVLIFLGIVIAYGIYLWAYTKGWVKGRLVLNKGGWYGTVL